MRAKINIVWRTLKCLRPAVIYVVWVITPRAQPVGSYFPATAPHPWGGSTILGNVSSAFPTQDISGLNFLISKKAPHRKKAHKTLRGRTRNRMCWPCFGPNLEISTIQGFGGNLKIGYQLGHIKWNIDCFNVLEMWLYKHIYPFSKYSLKYA